MEIEAFRITTPTVSQVIILFVVIFVFGVGLYIAARKTSPNTVSRAKGKKSGSSWHTFYQIAKARNLSKTETDLLRKLVLNCRLAKPHLVFTSMNVLDSCIQRTVRNIGMQEVRGESKEDVINMYYRLRNRIVRTREVQGITTTRAIPLGAQMRATVQNSGTFSVKVNRNEDDFLGISIPVLPPGRMIAWDRKKVKCSYWREEDAVYVFLTKVDDVVVTDELQAICLRHTDKVTRVQKRLYPRKSVRLPVFYSKVRVIEEGGRKKAIVDRKDTHWGTVIDLSVGGLSIESAVPFNRNNYLRVEFELHEDYKLVGFGKVKRLEQNRRKKTWIMHVQFTKIDKKHKNEIFELLYDYQTI